MLFGSARVEFSGLHAVAANLHVAPSAGVVFTGVEKEPAASVAGAGAKLCDPGGKKQGCRRLSKKPQGSGDLTAEAAPAPRDLQLLGAQATMLGRLLESFFEEREAG